ncbi:hypothetical protein [Clostridium porci]|uniref:Uncharacterized protein n=1 Tax=Clostridium porci TaxID=2605778 RepID=A0A7X2TCI9_9CLOT|nr:hypothetical protein [Clostridium porci]MSS36922.1 hypothetical protein [Clostridium porci]
MQVTAKVLLLGKVQKLWKDANGNSHTAFVGNIVQNNGEIIDTLRLTQEQYNMLEVNQSYIVNADFGVGKNGGYLRVVDITPSKA